MAGGKSILTACFGLVCAGCSARLREMQLRKTKEETLLAEDITTFNSSLEGIWVLHNGRELCFGHQMRLAR